jgi:hypothetical protein
VHIAHVQLKENIVSQWVSNYGIWEKKIFLPVEKKKKNKADVGFEPSIMLCLCAGVHVYVHTCVFIHKC